MVANLYQAMRELETEATYVFIAFAREEEGLLGSQFYLGSLSGGQKASIDCMINLDTLAVDGTFSWKNNSAKILLALIQKVAAKERLQLLETILHGGDTDSSTFLKAGIAAMTVFGASPEVIFDIIHSAKDTMAVFSLAHYKNAYLLTLALLRVLDASPVGPTPKAI
jgi:Zn-dependent M28 family amino/carboxypeptidase